MSESDTLARRASHVVLQPAGWPQPKGYANGIKARGEMVFVGGMIGWDENERFPPDFVEQRHGTDDFLYKARALMR